MGKARILIVDDTIDILRTLHLLLQERFEVILSPDGFSGYQKASRYLPDFIILDIMMPKMTGYQCYDQVRRLPVLKDIPVIFLSAKGTPIEQEYGLKKGAFAYIPKPFDPKGLIKTIDQMLLQHPPTPKDRPTYDQILMEEESKDRHVYWTG